MPIAILDHGLGPILLLASAPQPASELALEVAVPHERFDLARIVRNPGSGLAFGRKSGRFPAEFPPVQVDDALAPALVWNPSTSSVLRIDPAKVRYRLLF